MMKKTNYANFSKKRPIRFRFLNIFVDEDQNNALKKLKKECGMCECDSTISLYWPGGKRRKAFIEPKRKEKETKVNFHLRIQEEFKEYSKDDLFICNYTRCNTHFKRECISDFVKKSKKILK